MFPILIMIMVSQVRSYTRTYQIVLWILATFCMRILPEFYTHTHTHTHTPTNGVYI